MGESRVRRRAFERLELHEGKLSRAVLRGGGGGDVTSLPDTWVGNHPGLPGPDYAHRITRITSSTGWNRISFCVSWRTTCWLPSRRRCSAKRFTRHGRRFATCWRRTRSRRSFSEPAL